MLVFFIIIFLIIFILESSIRIKVENFNISNYEKAGRKLKLFLQITLFRKIVIFSIKLNTANMKKIYSKEKFDMEKAKSFFKIIKLERKHIKIKDMHLYIKIGAGNVILTAYIVSIISTILSYILPKYIEGRLDRNYFKILPIYEDEIKYNVSLNCIIPIKTVHIIHIIYLILVKRRDEKYVRASNRRSYENGYE